MELVYRVCEVTQAFPRHELYGLTNQIRRSAVSIASNIAEGKGRSSDKDLHLFLHHARGSLFELQTQLLIADHLKYMSVKQAEEIRELANEVGRLLSGFISFAVGA
jgi:four helix bundle protein